MNASNFTLTAEGASSLHAVVSRRELEAVAARTQSPVRSGVGGVCFSRTWAVPNADTFSVPVIADFVLHYLKFASVVVDPFSRNQRWATHTNDINPRTAAESHLDAVEFLAGLAERGVVADLVILDPPYSPRQISECYAEAGLKCGMRDTQNGRLYAEVKREVLKITKPGSTVLSFGWSSSGMQLHKGWEMVELMMVNHSGGRNDTICMAEVRRELSQRDFLTESVLKMSDAQLDDLEADMLTVKSSAGGGGAEMVGDGNRGTKSAALTANVRISDAATVERTPDAH